MDVLHNGRELVTVATPTVVPAADRPTSLSCSLALPSPTLPAPYHWRIFPIPPAPALFDQHVIDVLSVGQEDIRKGASVLVEAVGLDGHFLTEGRSWAGVVRQRHQSFLKRLLILHR